MFTHKVINVRHIYSSPNAILFFSSPKPKIQSPLAMVIAISSLPNKG